MLIQNATSQPALYHISWRLSSTSWLVPQTLKMHERHDSRLFSVVERTSAEGAQTSALDPECEFMTSWSSPTSSHRCIRPTDPRSCPITFTTRMIACKAKDTLYTMHCTTFPNERLAWHDATHVPLRYKKDVIQGSSWKSNGRPFVCTKVWVTSYHLFSTDPPPPGRTNSFLTWCYLIGTLKPTHLHHYWRRLVRNPVGRSWQESLITMLCTQKSEYHLC